MRLADVFPERRFKPTVLILGLIAIVSLAAAVAKSSAARPMVVVKMMDTPPSFEPMQTTIKAGETVEWQNVGNQLHHVTTDPAAALKKGDVSNPPGAKPFDSGFLKSGTTFSETFSVPGIYRYTYRYTCAVHEAKGMDGEIVVEK